MISIEVLVTRVSGLRIQDVERWIALDWVRPDGEPGQYAFQDIDVARVRLIQELRDHMQVNEDALPVVLSLLDQLYEMRRWMREIGDALGPTAPAELRESLARHLASRPRL
jgi:chaperone modulatory protein CbpM